MSIRKEEYDKKYLEYAEYLIPDDTAPLISEFLEQDARRFPKALSEEQEASLK